MRIFTAFFVFLCGLHLVSAQRVGCRYQPGMVICQGGVVPPIVTTGQVMIQGSRVTGQSRVIGMLSASKAHFNDLIVKGSVKLNDSRVAGKLNLHGRLEAKRSQLASKAILHSNNVKLTDTVVLKGLLINNNNDRVALVYIDGDSIVIGDIRFTAGHGEVYLRGNTVFKGSVIGGQIHRG